jgi:hypothetical protein
MKKLKFQSLMSGTRITMTNEEEKEQIGELPWLMEYKDTPDFIRVQYWWKLACISIEFQGWNEKVARSMFNNDQILTDVNISQEAKDKAYIKMSCDDQKTYWVKINRKDLWAELVEYFGSEEKVFQNYLRWFH